MSAIQNTIAVYRLSLDFTQKENSLRDAGRAMKRAILIEVSEIIWQLEIGFTDRRQNWTIALHIGSKAGPFPALTRLSTEIVSPR
ncbi:hypothetical protein [Asaia astilbis]